MRYFIVEKSLDFEQKYDKKGLTSHREALTTEDLLCFHETF